MFNIISFFQIAILKIINQNTEFVTSDSKFQKFVISKHKINDFNNSIVKIHEREFWLNGKLFDILKTEYLSDKIIFYCMNDTKEESILKELKEYIEIFVGLIKNNNSKKVFSNSDLSFTWLINSISKIKYFLKTENYNFNISNYYHLDEPPPLTPPPKYL